jgi:hypothetical protein
MGNIPEKQLNNLARKLDNLEEKFAEKMVDIKDEIQEVSAETKERDFLLHNKEEEKISDVKLDVKSVKTDVKEIKYDIDRIEKADKTLFKVFSGLHKKLMGKSPWYYKWHLKSYSNKVHWITFFTYLIALILVISINIYYAPQAVTHATAGVAKMINYQGKLTNASNIPVADGSYNLKISIYDSESAGSCLWAWKGSCGTPTAVPVTVTNGIFSVMLGDTSYQTTNALTLDFNTDSYFLGVTVGADAEMTPRKRIGAVGYAYNSDTVDGKNSTDFALLAGVAGGQTLNGGTAANNTLILQGNSTTGNTASNSNIQLKVGDSAGTTALTVLNNGNVGVGSISPNELLTVEGTLSLVEQTSSDTLTAGYGKIFAKKPDQPGIDSNVKLMLHMDGTDASTTFTDSEISPKTVTRNDNAQIDTNPSYPPKFGTGSGLFDGTNDYLSLADSADWAFGTGDFTVDFWVRFSSLPSSAAAAVVVGTGYNTTGLWTIGYYNANGTIGNWYIDCNGDRITMDNESNPTPGTWYHIEVGRASSSTKFFVNGTLKSGGGTWTSNLSATTPMYVGMRKYWGFDHDSDFNGWIDELRISKGVARHSATFSPQNVEYSTTSLPYDLYYVDSQGTESVLSAWIQNATGDEISYSGNIGVGQTDPTAHLEVEIGSTDGVTGLLVDQDDLDQIGLQISQAPDATANALDISSSQISGNIIDLDYVGAETQTGALSGINLDFTNLTTDGTNALYGIHLNDQVGATASTEYGIYIQGTNWDYGIYNEDASYLAGAITAATATNTINNMIINGSTQTFTANNMADSGALTVATGSNGNLTFNPNGTGAVITTLDGTTSVNDLQINRSGTLTAADALADIYGNRTVVTNTSGSLNDTANFVQFTSNITGTGTDTGSIMGLTQSHATASGDVLSISNSGTGKDINGTSSTWSVTKAGAAVFVGVNSGAGLLQGALGLTVTGNTQLSATAGNTVAMGNTTGTMVLASGGTSSWTNTAGNLTISTVTSGTLALDSAGALSVGIANQTGLTIGRVGSASTLNGSGLTVGPTAWTATPTISGAVTMTGGFDSNTASTVTSLTVDGATGAGDLTINSGETSFTSPATTTTANNFLADAITQGIGVALSADALTYGTALDISSTSIAGTGSNSSKLLNLARSGTNTNASHTAYGIYTAITNTGTTSTNIGAYLAASGASTNYALITNGGNVGIGTLAPTALLSVAEKFLVDSNGNITKINNVAYSWPGSQGGASTVLTNDGSGNLTWTTPTATNTAMNGTFSNLQVKNNYPDTHTKVLIHANDADASTLFIDSSLAPKGIYKYNQMQIDTAQSKFGGSSALFDGADDNLAFADSIDFSLGSNDFTIDFWVRFNALPGVGGWAMLVNKASSTADNMYIGIENRAGVYYLWLDVLSSSAVVVRTSQIITLSTSTWYHLAVVRSGSTFKLFKDGTQLGTDYTDSDPIPRTTGYLYLGIYISGDYDFNGWMDEFRFSKGIARWTANFTPPTSEYDGNPRSKVDINANSIGLYDGSSTKELRSVDLTADITVSGANGLDTGSEAAGAYYYIWVIAKSDNTSASLLSLSATSPTMPSGYTYKKLVGVVKNDSGSYFLPFYQKNSDYMYYSAILVLAAGASTSVAEIDLTSGVPPIADTALIVGQTTWLTSGSDYGTYIYADGNTVYSLMRSGFYSASQPTYAFRETQQFKIPLLVAQTIYYNVESATIAVYFWVNGFTLPI